MWRLVCFALALELSRTSRRLFRELKTLVQLISPSC